MIKVESKQCTGEKLQDDEELTDETLNQAFALADALLDSVLATINNRPEDEDSVLYGLWSSLTCILAAKGWTAKELGRNAEENVRSYSWDQGARRFDHSCHHPQPPKSVH
jgi:hypothetical protein